MARVPENERILIVELAHKEYTQRQIAAMTGRSTHTVNRIIKAYKEEKRICDAPHDRRPRATTQQQEQVLAAGAYASPFNTAKEIGEFCGVEASVSTLKRRLVEQGLRSRIAAQKPHLSEQNKTSRMGFAVNHAAWTVSDWKDVIFSDETTVSTVWDQKRRVWRPDCTRYEQCYLQEVATSGRTAVNIWGAMSRDGLGALHRIDGNLTAEKYANIVEYVLIPYALDGPFPDGDYYYQHDLSPVHTANQVKQLLCKRGVRQLEWPSKGADMNVIEHVWARLKLKLCQMSLTSASADVLWNAVKTTWDCLKEDRAFVDSLYVSLPHRMQAVIAAKGGMTRY